MNLERNLLLFALIIFSLKIKHATCGNFRFGVCPQVPVKEGFNMEKMYGDWYEIQSFQKTGNCVNVRLLPSLEKEDEYRLEASAILNIFKLFGITKPTLRNGNLTMPDPNVPAKMRLDFPSASKDFWIVDTDYKTFVATWSCKDVFFGHYESASIMSRKRIMDNNLLRKVRNIYAKHHVNINGFNFIGQKDCPTEEKIARDGVLFPL